MAGTGSMTAGIKRAQAADGCSLAYTLHGEAGRPRVVLIHSLALDGTIWKGVIGYLENDCELLTYDCRGHGASERRAGTYTADLFAGDLASVLDAAGWSDATIIGCSMGGCVAQAFAALHPQRVLGLGLVDTTAWYGPTAPQDWATRASKAEQEGLAALASFQATRWFGDAFRKQHPEIVKATMQVFLANDMACYQSACRFLGDVDLREQVQRLRVSTAVVVGEEDYATPRSMAEWLHTAIAGSSLTILRGARHLTPIEQPAAIADKVRQLIGSPD